MGWSKNRCMSYYRDRPVNYRMRNFAGMARVWTTKSPEIGLQGVLNAPKPAYSLSNPLRSASATVCALLAVPSFAAAEDR